MYCEWIQATLTCNSKLKFICDKYVQLISNWFVLLHREKFDFVAFDHDCDFNDPNVQFSSIRFSHTFCHLLMSQMEDFVKT